MTTPFQIALEAGDLHGLRACPKADLHVHAIGAGDRDFLRDRTGRDIAPVEGVLASMHDMHAWTDEHLGEIFAGAGGRALAYEAAFVQARRDGVNRIGADRDLS